MNRSEIVQLLTHCQAGDERSITTLVETYRPALYRMALSVLDDPAEADEATQDALVQALARLDSYRGECAFTNWLYAITLNACRGRLRKRRTRERLAQALQVIFRLHGSESEHPEHFVVQNESDQAVWQAIRSLPENLRLPIVLRYYHDLPIGEMAQVLQVSERTVHHRLHQAHERLGGMLGRRVEQ